MPKLITRPGGANKNLYGLARLRSRRGGPPRQSRRGAAVFFECIGRGDMAGPACGPGASAAGPRGSVKGYASGGGSASGINVQIAGVIGLSGIPWI
ncbi:hypothetical protein CENSYa_0085 [Cenarchaeum symbiosum A]|uniref:Uncharacterized protein n=1 Tax=Cenarchaeum symbiosum (strain A) TaxID=414004 RepID=A0RTR3_CENSY|nr:hypothetical protein CENSYa_0085 [Cenarchaeum symbiosum A]